MDDLTALYIEASTTPSDIFEHLETFVALTQELNAQHVIELGSRTGVSTIAWLYGLRDTGGRLTTIDLDPAPNIGTWDWWTHIQGDDTDGEIIQTLAPADIILIDTSHWFGHTLQELNIYRWLLKPGGVICLHDTELPRPEGQPFGEPAFPVKRAIQQFCSENGFDYTIDPRCWGLGMIKVG